MEFFEKKLAAIEEKHDKEIAELKVCVSVSDNGAKCYQN
jgi:hypothetical protein